MNRFTRLTKILIYSLLILISVGAFCFFGDQPVAYLIALIPVGLIILLITYFIIEKRTREARNVRNIAKYNKKYAKIIALDYQADLLVMQLQISNGSSDYITGLVIKRPDPELRRAYTVGNSIDVYVNPKNQYDVITENIYNGASSRFKVDWVLILIVGFNVSIFGVGFLVEIFNPEKQFQDIVLISYNDEHERIWEIYTSASENVHIKIYDPVNEKNIKTIKETKEKNYDSETKFFFSRQNNDVVLVGTGNTPVFDKYNAAGYNKLSDIRKFESLNTCLSKGISKLDRITFYNKFVKEDVVKFTTNDANIYFYNIQQNKFYDTENELRKYFNSLDSAQIVKNPYSFFLSYIPNSANKNQLYLIELTDAKAYPELLKLAGDNSLDIDYYNQTNKWNENHCKVKSLIPDFYFIEGKIIYFDSSMVIIEHNESVNKDSKEKISVYNKYGSKLFEIIQDDYPNVKDMVKNNEKPKNYGGLKIVRNNDKLAILFGKYGAINADLKTGKLLWKYEP